MATLKPQDRAAALRRRWQAEGCEIGRPREVELSVAIAVAQEAARDGALREMIEEIAHGLFSADDMAAFGVEDADDAVLVAADLNELAAERFKDLKRDFDPSQEAPEVPTLPEPEPSPDLKERPMQAQLSKLLQEAGYIGEDDGKFD